MSMMTILSLVLVVAMVAAMPSINGGKSARPPAAPRGPRPASRSKPQPARKSEPGVVTYALMEDKKLPSARQRAMRRIARPFNATSTWFRRRFGKPRADLPMAANDHPARPSAELENFIDARNREIARRKSEGLTKPGPDDRVH